MADMIDSASVTFDPLLLPVVVPQSDADKAEVRMRQIEQCLHAAIVMTVLVNAEPIAEWVRLNDALKPVSAQPDEKPKGGRPRAGVAEPARKLPLRGNQSESARRQFITRALRIAKIFDGAKIVVGEEKLDDNQAALLAIAAEDTEEAQIEVAKTWKLRNGRGHSGPVDTNAYTVTSLKRLTEAERQSLDQILTGLTAKFGVVVKHLKMKTSVPTAKEIQP